MLFVLPGKFLKIIHPSVFLLRSYITYGFNGGNPGLPRVQCQRLAIGVYETELFVAASFRPGTASDGSVLKDIHLSAADSAVDRVLAVALDAVWHC